MIRVLSFLMLAVLASLTGCSPALNWREVEGVEGARWWFPCKPDRVERTVVIREQPVPARLAVCDAQGASWSTMALQFPGPAEAAQALDAAQLTLKKNLQATERPQPAGLTLKEAAPQWLAGRRPGGEPVQAAMQFRVQGPWLVQRVLMVNQADESDAWPAVLRPEALDTFFAGAMPR